MRSLFSPHENTHIVFLFHIAIAYCNGILQGQKIGTFKSFSEHYFYRTQLNLDFAIDSFLTEPLSTFPQHIYFPYTVSGNLHTVFQTSTQWSWNQRDNLRVRVCLTCTYKYSNLVHYFFHDYQPRFQKINLIKKKKRNLAKYIVFKFSRVKNSINSLYYTMDTISCLKVSKINSTLKT